MAKVIGTILKYLFVPPKKRDHVIAISLLVLIIFSSIMIVSASMSTTGASIGSSFLEILKNLKNMGVIREAKKQLIIVIVSYVGYCLCSNIYSIGLAKKVILVIAGIVMILLIVASFRSNSTVSNAWIMIGPISIQPSELAKPTIIMLIAVYLCDMKSNKPQTVWAYLKFPAIFFICTVLIVFFAQNDLGSAFSFAGIGCLTFLVVGSPRYKTSQRIVLGCILLVFVIAILLMIPEVTNYLYNHGFFRYQLARFKNVLDPTWDRYGYSRELLNSLIAIMKGNLFGVGIGESVLKFGYIASSNADYIFPIIIEETGIVGVAIIAGCYTFILVPLMYYAFKARKNAQKCIFIGAISYLFIHMFLNIGGVSALIPSTGVPLLLVSAGGTSSLSIMCLLGICQRIISDIKKGEVE